MLKRTPLFTAHQKLGGKLVEFGGWEMPVQYTSITDEHLAVRQAASARTELPPEAILISATHTHSGPAAMRTYSETVAPVDTNYKDELEKRLAQVIASALPLDCDNTGKSNPARMRITAEPIFDKLALAPIEVKTK